MNIKEILSLSESEARDLIEEMRWPNGPVCPHCGETRQYELKGKAHRPGLYKCAGCRQQYSVTVGTIMEGSHAALGKWLAAMYLMVSSKKGMSANQIHRMLGVTYKTAWFMCHRIRLAMETEEYAHALSGIVEVDETYVGGKPRRGSGRKNKPGRGTKKTPVVALVERGGEARVLVTERVDGKTLKGAIRENVDRASKIMTDEWAAYKGIGREFEGGHHTVNHGAGEYSRGEAHCNSAESYFSLLKRGVYGTFHHVSKAHLHRYCQEFNFRWNTKGVSDFERACILLGSVGGKRLMYQRPA